MNSLIRVVGTTTAVWAANYFSIAPLTSNPGVTATTSISYDNNGNVIQVGTTTFYTYDYQNRLTQSAIWNGTATTTTTYAYGPFGNRVSQTTASTTFIYPNKFYSVASSTGTGATYATTTDYVYAGSNLLATIDQKIISGTASGTAITRYNHTDNLGSTNVTSDATMGLAQWFDYAPYGSVIATTNTGQAAAARGYIGQFTDASTLSYLNARYYNSSQGHFISQDPSFLSVGNPALIKQVTGRDQQTFLSDPQLANSYSYGRDNPVAQRDPDGTIIPIIIGALAAYGWAQSYVDYVNFQTVTTYPEQFSDTEIRDTGYKLVSDILLAGVAREATDVEDLVWGAGNVILDAIDMHCANHTCLNFSSNSPAMQTAAVSSNISGSNGTPASRSPSSQSQNGPIQQAQKSQYGSPANGGGGGGGGNQSLQAQLASIQAQIYQIQAQINAIVQQQSASSRR